MVLLYLILSIFAVTLLSSSLPLLSLLLLKFANELTNVWCFVRASNLPKKDHSMSSNILKLYSKINLLRALK